MSESTYFSSSFIKESDQSAKHNWPFSALQYINHLHVDETTDFSSGKDFEKRAICFYNFYVAFGRSHTVLSVHWVFYLFISSV